MNSVSRQTAPFVNTNLNPATMRNRPNFCTRWCVQICQYLGSCVVLICSALFCCCFCPRKVGRIHTADHHSLQPTRLVGTSAQYPNKITGDMKKKRQRMLKDKKKERDEQYRSESEDESPTASARPRRRKRRSKHAQPHQIHISGEIQQRHSCGSRAGSTLSIPGSSDASEYSSMVDLSDADLADDESDSLISS